MKESTPTTLPESSLLEQLDAAERAALSAFGEFLLYDRNAVLITEGGSQDFLYYVVSGTLHATLRRGNILLGRITEGEWFGEVNVIDPGTASATVAARTRACVWRISRSDMERFISEHPVLGARVLLSVAVQLAKRLRGVNERFSLEVSRAMLSIRAHDIAEHPVHRRGMPHA